MSLRVLIVDDSVVFRKLIRNVLNEIPDVEVVGYASNGRFALSQIRELKPDLLTLDLQMPELGGLGVLRELGKELDSCGAIVVSSLTLAGAQCTTEALALGAFDFILKPSTSSFEDSFDQLKDDLAPKVAAFVRTRQQSHEDAGVGLVATDSPRFMPEAEIVVIGVSTGGPAALGNHLPAHAARLPTSGGCGSAHAPGIHTNFGRRA